MPASAPPEPRGHRVETPLRVLARLASKNPACGGGAAGGGGGLGALNADRVRERLSSPCVLSRKATRGWRIVTHSKAQKYRRLARECLVLARTVSTEEARASLRAMAQAWHRLADEQDQGSELGSMPPFTAERTQPVVQQQQQVRPRDDDKKE